MIPRHDFTPLIGLLGFVGSISLDRIDAVVSILVGLTTLTYVVTKWVVVIRKYGGFCRVCPLRLSSPLAPLPQVASAQKEETVDSNPPL
jgi:hypothetical protein